MNKAKSDPWKSLRKQYEAMRDGYGCAGPYTALSTNTDIYMLSGHGLLVINSLHGMPKASAKSKKGKK